jgi:hypothetical protein
MKNNLIIQTYNLISKRRFWFNLRVRGCYAYYFEKQGNRSQREILRKVRIFPSPAGGQRAGKVFFPKDPAKTEIYAPLWRLGLGPTVVTDRYCLARQDSDTQGP